MIKKKVKKRKKNPANWYSAERILDNEKVLGITADNQLIDYLGLKCLLKPSIFLKLVDTDIDDLKDDSYDFIKLKMKEKIPIAHPFLRLLIPDEWFIGEYSTKGFRISDTPPIIYSHEGRHRITASFDLYGDIPVEVFLFFKGKKGKEIRNRHIDNNFIINLLNNNIISEFLGKIIRNPIKKLVY